METNLKKLDREEIVFLLRKIIYRHQKVWKIINKDARTKKQKIDFINSLSYNLNEECQIDLNLLGELTIISPEPKIYDHCKNIVFKTLGYCVGESL